MLKQTNYLIISILYCKIYDEEVLYHFFLKLKDS